MDGAKYGVSIVGESGADLTRLSIHGYEGEARITVSIDGKSVTLLAHDLFGAMNVIETKYKEARGGR